jgi:hypothetical protein
MFYLLRSGHGRLVCSQDYEFRGQGCSPSQSADYPAGCDSCAAFEWLVISVRGQDTKRITHLG